MGKQKKLSMSTSSSPSAMFTLGRSYHEKYSLCCFFCCSIYLKTAAIIIGILDALGQIVQFYRYLELWILLPQCSNPVTSIVLFLMTVTFVVDIAVLVCLFAGIILNNMILVIPILYRYIFSIIFDSLFILYAAISFLFVDGTLKRPLIWIYQNLRQCPSESVAEVVSSFTNETISVHLGNYAEFEESEFSQALDSTLLNVLCVSVVQFCLQLWFLVVLKKYSEFLYLEAQENRRRFSSAGEALVP